MGNRTHALAPAVDKRLTLSRLTLARSMQQRLAMSDVETLLRKSKSLCQDHDCPECGTSDHVTAEVRLIGNITMTVCHCRVCGHSWHPHVEAEPL